MRGSWLSTRGLLFFFTSCCPLALQTRFISFYIFSDTISLCKMAELVVNNASSRFLEYIFHHVFLPPKLPNGDDAFPAKELCLIELVRDCLAEFLPKTHRSNHGAIDRALALIINIYTATSRDGYLQEDGVRAVLKQIRPHSGCAPCPRFTCR